MKTINEDKYYPNLGILIDVRSKDKYMINHNPYSINIPYDNLMMNYKKLLDKRNKYYLICDKGHKSKQAVRILSFYGYDVTYVINS